jgi:hypothetical protein
VKRARAAKVHAHIVSHLKKEMPAMMGKAKAQQKLLDSLDEQFAKVITDQRSSLTVTTLTVYMYSHPSIYTTTTAAVSEAESTRALPLMKLNGVPFVLLCRVYYLPRVQVQKELHLPPGDFPSVDEYRELLSAYNLDKFEKLRPRMVQGVDDMLAYDIPELLKKFRNPYD